MKKGSSFEELQFQFISVIIYVFITLQLPLFVRRTTDIRFVKPFTEVKGPFEVRRCMFWTFNFKHRFIFLQKKKIKE